MNESEPMKVIGLDNLDTFRGEVSKEIESQLHSISAADIGALTDIEIGTVTTGNAGSKASVMASTNGTVTTLDLIIPKGDKGDKGDTGAAAGFGTPTATIDNNTGTPSVTVTASGANTAKVFNFAFKNLKGAKGDKGETGATGAQGVQGAKGDKGDKGDTGAQGVAGAKGATGAKGDKGDFGVQYSTCSTAAATAAKTAALTGFVLATGAAVMIRFTVTNTAANPTLNVNNTGAKAIRYRNAAISAGYLAANRTYMFVYDGTYWQLVGDLDTNTHTVTGIKGNAESTYRTGNVNLTPANIGAAASNHTHVSTGTVSVPATGWSSDSTAIFPKYYDLSISGILATDRVDLIVAIASLDTALKCGLCGVTEASAGKVRIRSRTVPTAAISLQYWVMKK